MSNSKFGLRTRKGIIRPFVEGAQAILFDADALAYFTANTAITSTADKNAINTFYLGLKSDGIYTKIKAMYLPLWSSASSNKWNLVNPVDSNAAYRLTFATGWTHTSTGMTPNGATYADTSLIPSTALSLNSAHISYYSRTNATSTTVDMGNYDNINNGSILLLLRDSNLASIRMNNLTIINYSNTDSLGLHISNRTASNVITGWKNGIKKITSAVASTILPTNQIYMGAFRDGTGPAYYSLRECAFASIGDGLTDAEATNFYSRVNTLMTYFGINVY